MIRAFPDRSSWLKVENRWGRFEVFEETLQFIG
jgi:hypothetical protein